MIKTALFLKLWINMSLIPEVDAMIDKEGSKGYGTYIYLLEKLFLLGMEKAPITYLKSISRKGFSAAYMKQFIMESGLFIVEGDFFYAPELNRQLCDMEEKSEEKAKMRERKKAKKEENMKEYNE